MKRKVLYLGLAILITGAALLYRDSQCRQFAVEEESIHTADLNQLRLLIESEMGQLSRKEALKTSMAGGLANTSSPFCAHGRYFADTKVLDHTELIEAMEYLNRVSGQLSFSETPEEVWITDDHSFGILLQSSEGIGFFRDYYHEIVYDPHNKVQTERMDEKCFPTLAVKELDGYWKYRLVSSQWD